MTARYALYFAPSASHPLWVAGCRWLGRDPESGARFESANGRKAHRTDPRRYGFHATLKPPFALRDGSQRGHLLAALTRFVDERAAFAMPELAVATLGDFVALRPVDPSTVGPGEPLRELADDCVRLFDEFRCPPSAQERQRRLDSAHDEARRRHVERWGYPHVFEHWRFHMTLTDGIADVGVRTALTADAARHFAAALATPLRCGGVALFVEDPPGADFRLLRRFDFARGHPDD